MRLRVRWYLDQCSDQSQQCLLFGSLCITQELAQLNVREPATRGSIGLMDDESMTIFRLASDEPCVAIWTAIELPPVTYVLLPKT